MTNNTKLQIRLTGGLFALALGCISTLFLPTKVEAAVYKCTDTEGNVSYNQIPCSVEEKAETVLGVKSSRNTNVDCRIANNFARQISTRMRSGQSSGAVFDSYGGIDAIPSTAVGIINYVYSHKGNLETGSQRVTALSAARCSAGSYGPVNCDNFPYNYIAELGGCERAKLNTTSTPSKVTSTDQSTNAVQEGTTQALGARTIVNENTSPADCQQDLQAELNDIVEQMRSGQTANELGQLEERKTELRKKRPKC